MGAENHTGMAVEWKAKRIGAGMKLRGLLFAVGHDSKQRWKVTELLYWNVLRVCERRLQVPQPVTTELYHAWPHPAVVSSYTKGGNESIKGLVYFYFASLLRLLQEYRT